MHIKSKKLKFFLFLHLGQGALAGFSTETALSTYLIL